ncbi:DUF1173 family protein [Edaphobacter modestus]|uniref:Uncharacterized protein DUF1173 n=1 Tax=Edaphobacter modestus TaxID=388466 RepID=A0A4Q7XX13_9BACT|nr:DUF1173 family protein [Edaphobacter modestus]RZU28907.1 uncharacterized protein DUF1173 [Edaphobacter modestus]
MTRYRIGEIETNSDSVDFQVHVARAYREKVRPLCLCREPGIPMYIAHFEQGFLVKRMPDSGEEHAADCESYETPADLSGRGEVDGQAIQHEEGGLVNLKLAFSLRRNGMSEKPKEALEHSSATATGTRLTLRGFLHYLWEESRLNHWTPGMMGKRSWFVVRKYLLLATESKETKRSPLADVLYIPEHLGKQRQEETIHRRTMKLSPIMGPGNFGKKLMVLVGEVETIAEARFGFALKIKHLPDLPFMMSPDLHKQFDKLFQPVIRLWEHVDDGHLMAIATFTMDANGVPEVQEIAVMLTTAEWLPVENTHDNNLVRMLVKQERGFRKNLRYNLTYDKPIASATLTDLAGPALPMYLDLDTLVGKWASSDAIRELITNSKLVSWVWEPKLGILPPLPPKYTKRVDAPAR